MNKKVLVFGGRGMAGHMIVSYLKSLDKYQIYNTVNRERFDKNSILCNVVDIEKLREIIENIAPDVIINGIGILNDKSDKDVVNTSYVNSFFPKILENIGYTKDIKIIHLSTDCVFSGKRGSYTEKDIKDETSIYGFSKNIGEIINKKDLTFRTSIIGPELKENGKGLFHWFMNQNESINGYSNVYWSGVTTLELAKAIDKAIDENLCGLYHLVYKEKISKYDLLKLINKEFEKNINIDIFSDKFSDKSMVNTRIDFNFEVSDYREMIKDMKNWMINNKDMYKQYFK